MSREVDNVPMISKKHVVHNDTDRSCKVRDGRRFFVNGIGLLVCKPKVLVTEKEMPVGSGLSCRDLFEKRFSSVKNRGINF